MRKIRSHFVWAILVASLGSGCATAGSGWQRTSEARTGRVYSRFDLGHEVPGLIFGDSTYAEVNSAWLPEWYELYRRRLFDMGIVRWSVNFDCNRFADLYVSMAQACNSDATFHAESKPSLAIGTVWYRRDESGSLHAIVQAFTERGRIFVDPQTGEIVNLSSGEVRSIFLQTI
jgi:hypothetical protein